MTTAPADGRFGVEDVLRSSGLTYRELQYAIGRGWLTTATTARGSGTVFRFALGDVRRARVFAAARRAGLSAPASARLATAVLAGARRLELGPGLIVSVDEPRLPPKA